MKRLIGLMRRIFYPILSCSNLISLTAAAKVALESLMSPFVDCKVKNYFSD